MQGKKEQLRRELAGLLGVKGGAILSNKETFVAWITSKGLLFLPMMTIINFFTFLFMK